MGKEEPSKCLYCEAEDTAKHTLLGCVDSRDGSEDLTLGDILREGCECEDKWTAFFTLAKSVMRRKTADRRSMESRWRQHKMDDQTAFVLALQLIALCTVVSALILYLMCKIPRNYFSSLGANGVLTYQNVGGGKAVLITSVENFLGLHLAYHLSTRGFRVFAGVKPSEYEAEDQKDGTQSDSLSRKILEAKWKHFEAFCKKDENESLGNLITLPLDVCREDLLHEAVGLIRRYLPAGEDGLWAVINTAGLPCNNARSDGQGSAHWDAVIKLNVTGMLKVSKTFMPLLRTKKGRLVNLGAKIKGTADESRAQIAHTASRFAVEGASAALRSEMKLLGVDVVTLHPEGLCIPKLFSAPNKSTVTELDRYIDCDISVLPLASLQVIEDVLLTDSPKGSYSLVGKMRFFRLRQKVIDFTNSIQIV